MKRQLTLIVQEFEPVDDREMGSDGGFRVLCAELELAASDSTLIGAMFFMAKMIIHSTSRSTGRKDNGL